MLFCPHMLNNLLLRHILYAEVTMAGGTSNLTNILCQDDPDPLSESQATRSRLFLSWGNLHLEAAGVLSYRLADGKIISVLQRCSNKVEPQKRKCWLSRILANLLLRPPTSSLQGSNSANQGLLINDLCQTTEDPALHFPYGPLDVHLYNCV